MQVNGAIWKWIPCLAGWSTNPAAVAVLGFALTGILGTYFVHQLDDYAKQREEETASRRRAFEAVRDISELFYERRVRSVMYASALEHGAREAEVTPAKKAYEDVFTRWNAKLQSNTFQIREITGNVGSQKRSSLEEQFLQYLQPLLDETNRCVYRAYLASVSDGYNGAKNAEKILTECSPAKQVPGRLPVSIDRLHAAISECGYVFVNALYTSIHLSTDLRAKAEQIADRMAHACAVKVS